MNEWLLLIPIGVLVLDTAPAFAWMHHVNERDRHEARQRLKRCRAPEDSATSGCRDGALKSIELRLPSRPLAPDVVARDSQTHRSGRVRYLSGPVKSRQISFSSKAFATACVLFVTLSLYKLDVTWNVTVRSVMPRIFEISSAVLPMALQRSTSHSRSVR